MKASYKDMNNELEDLLAQMQNGDIDLDEAIEKYKKALATVEKMEQYLKNAKAEIKKIEKA